MSKEIKVPEVGESITEGMLTAWLQDEGAMVEQGDPLFELETDKITMEVPSPHTGRLHIEVPAGETVQVGQVVGRVDTSADASGPDETARPASREAAEAPSTSPETERSSTHQDSTQPPTQRGVPGFGPSAPAAIARIPSQQPALSTEGEASSSRADSVKADPRASQRSPEQDSSELSPAVRRLVMEHQLTPEEISASGPGGRLTKADVLAYLESGQQPPDAALPAAGVPVVTDGSSPSGSAPQPQAARHAQDQGTPAETPRLAARPPARESSSVSHAEGSRQTRAKMSPLRTRIAQRLVEAQQTAAMLTTFNEVDMSAVLDLRERFKAPFEKKHGIRLGFMSFFIKAAVDALKTVPRVNAFIDGNDIVTNHFYDIGVAVGTDRGLVVPVIRDCDLLDFAGIEQAIADYARKVKEKKIGLEDLQGGCFTLSNGGVYGSLLSTPILNPPQAAILGMHAIKKRPVVVDDQIVIRPMMYLALSYDHRLVDGKDAVTFLRRIVECLEAPERILMDV